MEEAVNSLGLGSAQLSVLLLGAGGIAFCDGMEFAALGIVTLSTAQEFNLGPNEKGLLMTLAIMGMFAGIIAVGYVGDTMGRRLPVVASFAVMAVFGFASVCAPGFRALLACRMMLGFGIGIGIPPSIALLSEITPTHWRMLMRCLTYVCWNFGTMFVVTTAATVDPTLKHVQWRSLLFYSSCPVVIWWMLSSFYLPESPVFLASIGQQSEAQEVLDMICSRNGIPCTDICRYSPSQASTSGASTLSQQIEVLFSRRYCFTTIIITLASVSLHVTSYCYTYAGPQILVQTSSVDAAWEMMLLCAVTIAIISLLWIPSEVLSRRGSAVLALCFNTMVCFALAWAGGKPAPRTLFYEVMFQFGYLGNTAGSTLGYMVLFQIAVEVYPANASTTGGSFIIGVGRMGAMMAPLLFEHFKAVHAWYTLFGGLCALNALCVGLLYFLPDLETLKDDSISEMEPHDYGAASGS